MGQHPSLGSIENILILWLGSKGKFQENMKPLVETRVCWYFFGCFHIYVLALFFLKSCK